MIPQLQKALYTYLTGSGTFISLLGVGNLHPNYVVTTEENPNFPYCVFYERQRISASVESIDSADQYPDPEIVFEIYTGSNTGVKEDAISGAQIRNLTEALISQLNLKDDSTIPIDNYQLLNIELIDSRKLMVNPKSNAVHVQTVFFRILLQTVRT